MKKASNVKAKKKSLYYTARYLPKKKNKRKRGGDTEMEGGGELTHTYERILDGRLILLLDTITGNEREKN